MHRFGRLARRLALPLALGSCALPPLPTPPPGPPPPATEPVPVGAIVPDLRGLSLFEARQRLQAAGLRVGRSTRTSVPAGTVWKQDLAPGTRVTQDAAVTLEVADDSVDPLSCPIRPALAACAGRVEARHSGRPAWRRSVAPPARSRPGQLAP